VTRPLWVDPDSTAFPVLDGDITVDVAVIGGGLSGMGAANGLVESEASAAVVEARTVGSGASGRNGGFVLAGPAPMYHDAVARAGATGARALWDFTLANNRRITALVEEFQLDVGYMRRGSASLAVDAEEMQIFEHAHASLSGAGLHTSLLDQHELPRPFSERYLGGLYFAGNAEMNSGAFCRAIAATLPSTVQVFEQTRVRDLYRTDHWEVHTDRAVVHAGAVILCTNAYTRAVQPGLDIVPTRGQVLSTVPLDLVIVPFPMYANYGFQYWRQTVDGRLVVGGWRDLDIEAEVGSEERAHPHIQQALADFCRFVTGHEPEIERRWSGIMGFTPDHLPYVGAVPGQEQLYVAAGYSGHGVSMAFECGRRVALNSLGRQAALPLAFDPGRKPKRIKD